MNYENILEKFIQWFPEQRQIINTDDVECGLYVVFGLSINPYVIDLLINDEINTSELTKLFDFFEEMAISEDEKVKELLMYSLLERLGDSKEILAKAKKYMGSETKKLSELIENFWGRSEVIHMFLSRNNG